MNPELCRIVGVILVGLTISCFGEVVPIPDGVPLEIDPPHHETTRGLTEAILIIGVAVIASCIIIYAYREKADPWDAHAFVLERDAYNDDWKQIGYKEVALSPAHARALFADEFEYEAGYRYRVLDLGSVYFSQ